MLKPGTGSGSAGRKLRSLSTGASLSVAMFFCLLRLGSRLGPHPVSGQSVMVASAPVRAAGHAIATFSAVVPEPTDVPEVETFLANTQPTVPSPALTW